MENNPRYEIAALAVPSLFTLMARTGSDPTEVRMAKDILRWSSVVAGAAAVAVVVLSSAAAGNEDQQGGDE